MEKLSVLSAFFVGIPMDFPSQGTNYAELWCNIFASLNKLLNKLSADLRRLDAHMTWMQILHNYEHST